MMQSHHPSAPTTRRRLAKAAATALGAGALLVPLGLPAGASASTLRASHTTATPRTQALRISPGGRGRTGPTAHVAALRLAPQSSAAVPTLYVDPTTGVDSGTCRLKADPCATITYALTQAPTTVIVHLAAATDAEQVVIPAGMHVTIDGSPACTPEGCGAGAGKIGSVIQPTALATTEADPSGGDPVYPVIDVTPTAALTLHEVEVDGSKAQSQFTGCGQDFVGVYDQDATVTLTQDQVTNIALPASLDGCQDGQAIYAASGPEDTTSLSTSYVVVHGYQKNGIACYDTGTTCQINHTAVTGAGAIDYNAQNGLVGYGATSVSIGYSNFDDDAYTPDSYSSTGVLLIDDATATVSRSTATGDDVGFYASDDGAQPSGALVSLTGDTASNEVNASSGDADGFIADTLPSGTLSNDKASEDGGYGVAVYNGTGVGISGGTFTSDGDGVYLGGYSGNPGSATGTTTGGTIAGNSLTKDTGDGILADTETSGVTLTGNKATADATYDFQDLSTGGGTAGTANTWTSNTCRPLADSSPEGLC